MPQRQILFVCRDDQRARTPMAALTQAGYHVLTADTTRAFDLLVGQKFDAVVLGEKLPRRERLFLAGLTRERWSTPVVLLRLPDSDPDIQADVHVDSSSGPDALLDALAGILDSKAPAGAGSAE